jgi:hypothetical protein
MLNSFEVESIGLCEKKKSHKHVSNSVWLPRQNSWNVQIEHVVNGKEEKITCS